MSSGPGPITVTEMPRSPNSFEAARVTISEAGIPATVLVVESTGAETHIVMLIGSQTAAMVLHYRIALRPVEATKVVPYFPRRIFSHPKGYA
ncbi:hypothetical protein [Rhizobium mongolense]|uniref:Uncharacterized protein n=1 Tax=Rhizobium mongolense TaxID=57676 RepID=A0A7W6RUS4_9HYPH|nr:hypothetical protein [Rhizobium mongolense]MBB4279027.1 hypothetical protein [Rhizobium mongolense]